MTCAISKDVTQKKDFNLHSNQIKMVVQICIQYIKYVIQSVKCCSREQNKQNSNKVKLVVDICVDYIQCQTISKDVTQKKTCINVTIQLYIGSLSGGKKCDFIKQRNN